MTKLKDYAVKMRDHRPRVLVQKAAGKLARKLGNAVSRQQDRRHTTYAACPTTEDPAGLRRYFPAPDVSALDPALVRALAEHYLAHRFDLLGSGWTIVRHGIACRGWDGHRHGPHPEIVADANGNWLENRLNAANLDTAKSIWRLVGRGYQPIDWQLDFKSGYRWNERTWYRDIRFQHLPGVDIKVPWELSRMHHLPQLAEAYALAMQKHEGFAAPECCLQEFRNQVLDFIATNPPRYGVNWACAMDVAIRLVNWLVAFDLFRAAGAAFDQPFVRILIESVYQHGRHIVANLEWSQGIRGNHYLSDIAGLLFAAAYLPRSPEIDAWLAFAVQELVVEVGAQFHDDGSNFEASTVYHRLSSEIVVYATALILALPSDKQAALQSYDHRRMCGKPELRPAPIPQYPIPGQPRTSPFPEFYWRRLERMAEFTTDLTRPDGRVVQIGDNDSGRLLKLCPAYATMKVRDAKQQYGNLQDYTALPDDADYLLENHLDHRHLVAAVNGLFQRDDFAHFASGSEFETGLLRALVQGQAIHCHGHVGESHAAGWRFENTVPPSPNIQGMTTRDYLFSIEQRSDRRGLLEGLRCYSYPDFGVYLCKSERLYLAIRCGPIGMNGLGPHAHNDPLSIELWLDQQPIIIDPGTYIYTAHPALRDTFRSVAAHFAPHVEGLEPGNMKKNIFALGDEAKPECLYFSEHGFLGRYHIPGGEIFRKITIDGLSIKVIDWTTAPGLSLAKFPAGNPGYSDGYGWIASSPSALPLNNLPPR